MTKDDIINILKNKTCSTCIIEKTICNKVMSNIPLYLQSCEHWFQWKDDIMRLLKIPPQN